MKTCVSYSHRNHTCYWQAVQIRSHLNGKGPVFIYFLWHPLVWNTTVPYTAYSLVQWAPRNGRKLSIFTCWVELLWCNNHVIVRPRLSTRYTRDAVNMYGEFESSPISRPLAARISLILNFSETAHCSRDSVIFQWKSSLPLPQPLSLININFYLYNHLVWYLSPWFSRKRVKD